MSEGSLKARTFLEAVAGFTDEPEAVTAPQDRPNKLATVDALHAGGDPKVLFDGEALMGLRTYKALVPVAANDRVVLAPVGNTYVIIGVVGSTHAAPFAFAAGTIAAASVAAGATAVTAVALPAGRFTLPPIVTASVAFTGATALQVAVDQAAATASSVTIRRSNDRAGAIVFGATWMAIQMTATSAAG